MDRRDNYGGRGRGRESGGTGGGRGWGQGHGRGRGRGSSDQPPYSTNRGGRGQGQGHGQGRGRGRGSWDQPRPSLPERISETPATGRGRGSWDQPRPSLPERISETPATVLATEMDDALTISTSEFHTAEGASSSIDGGDGILVDVQRRRKGEKWCPSPQEHISNTIATVLDREMKIMAISTSALPTSEGASSSISMASTKESAGSAHIPSNSVSLESIPSSRETKEETGQIRRSALVPMNRPKPVDRYPKQKSIILLVNHFYVKFDRDRKIYHYDFDIQRVDKKEKRGSGKTEKEMQESGVSDTSENKNGPVSRISKEDALKIKNKMVQDNIAGFGNANIVFDGQKNIYSVESLPEGKDIVELLREEGAVKKFEKFEVALKNTGHELNGSPLFNFLDTNENNHTVLNADLLQCLNLVMREHPSSNRFLLGGSLYPMKFEQDFGGGVGVSRGFYQSLRPTAQGLVLNVDMSAIVFHKNIGVLEYLRERYELKTEEDTRAFSIEEQRKVRNALVGLKVRVTHRSCSQKFTIRGLTEQKTNEIRFPWSPDNGPEEMISVPDFFLKKYKCPIRLKLLPCLDISKTDNSNYIPMELCVLCEGQRIPRDNLSRSKEKRFIQIVRPSADERQQKINGIMETQDGPKGGPFLPDFRLEVDGRMTEVKGRVLEAPTLQLGIKSVKKGQVEPVIPHQKKWNLMNNHVFDGKRIEKWGFICFSNARNIRDLERRHNNFMYALIRRCEEVGMSMNPTPLVGEYQPMSKFNDNEALKQTLLNVDTKAKGELQILICSMEEKHEGYKTLKLIAETNIGLVTQCCLFENVMKCSDQRTASQYLANLALKMNAKVGGSNVALSRSLSRHVPGLGDGHVMCIGADVNHPGSKDKTSPSIAAVVGSINWPYYNRYNARVNYQKSRAEHIEKLKGMSKELLDDYIKANKRLPDRILFFRDGVSESQFDMVLNEELVALKEAVAQFKDYNPPVSFIVAQKRHHTRLFLGQGEQRTKSGNVPPGTVVDTVIVHPRQFDFYLCSHEGLLGTSKPTHYHVLWDENNFSSDELETLINNLCYTFARCTKPVSLVPPVYYADLAAYRGRLHLQASQALAIAELPELHDGVKNRMFFC